MDVKLRRERRDVRTEIKIVFNSSSLFSQCSEAICALFSLLFNNKELLFNKMKPVLFKISTSFFHNRRTCGRSFFQDAKLSQNLLEPYSGKR